MKAPGGISVELWVLEDDGGRGYLFRTDRGKACYGPLDMANTYSSMKAVHNAVSRIKDSDFSIHYRRVKLELLP